MKLSQEDLDNVYTKARWIDNNGGADDDVFDPPADAIMITADVGAGTVLTVKFSGSPAWIEPIYFRRGVVVEGKFKAMLKDMGIAPGEVLALWH